MRHRPSGSTLAATYDDPVQETVPRSGTPAPTQPRTRLVLSRRTAWGLGAGAGLFAAAAIVPRLTGTDVHLSWVGWPPLAAEWSPRLGPGTAAAVVIAVGLVVKGHALASHLPWRRLVLVTWLTGLAWTLSLALVDGPQGISRVFARPTEYVYDARTVTSVPQLLTEFTARIPLGTPYHWQTHVGGHPPGALLVFVGLDRIGISDPLAVGLVVLTAGTTVIMALLIAAQALAGEQWARRAAPFLAGAPAAIWVGVSADALYAAVAAWGLALLALAATRARGRVAYSLLAGVLLGWCCYLSYGLVLLAILAVAVLLVARNASPLPWAVAGALAVAAAFTAGGFVWWDGYAALRTRYYAGLGGLRPYWYWVWADLAAATAATGLGVWAALGHTSRALLHGRTGDRAIAVLGSAGVLCMLAATLSAMSKAEVERIWLPFSWWALLLAALLPSAERRWLLGVQAATGLALASLLRPGW